MSGKPWVQTFTPQEIAELKAFDRRVDAEPVPDDCGIPRRTENERRAHKRELDRAWYAAHREKVNAAQKRWYAAHREEMRAYHRAYYAAKRSAAAESAGPDSGRGNNPKSVKAGETVQGAEIRTSTSVVIR